MVYRTSFHDRLHLLANCDDVGGCGSHLQSTNWVRGLVPTHYHPVRLAEDLAVIDILSKGRLEVGVGLGWSVDEYRCFGVETDKRLSIMREALDVLRLAWTEEEFSFHGKHFQLDALRVQPKPSQKPHPPIWGGVTSAEGARRIARWGLPLFWIDREIANAYLEAYKKAGHPIENAKIDGYINLFVCDKPDEVWPLVRDQYFRQTTRNTGLLAVAPGGAIYKRPVPTMADVEELARSGGILLVTPEQAVEEIQNRTKDLPVTGFICHNRIVGMPDELSERHVELLASVVRPALN
jgi:alkanesulfonate monooxygenase SsuD/methylene tetrahydromethanopterin reductase-like flavin-dependent oxidoreductase (luciferase family)